MDLLHRDDFSSKLVFVLKKVIELQNFEDTFLDKFLHITQNEICERPDNLPDLSDWLLEIVQKWKCNISKVGEISFVCRLIGIITKYEKGFYLMQKSNALNEFHSILNPMILEKSALKSVYINYLFNILSHVPGYDWIKNTKQWKMVFHLYYSNSSLYVEREGLNFLKAFVDKSMPDNDINEAVLEEIFLPVKDYSKTGVQHKESVTLLLLKLLETVLRANVLSRNQSFALKVLQMFDLSTFLVYLMENSQDETVLDEAIIVRVLLFATQCEDKKEVLDLENSPVIEIFHQILKRHHFSGLISLSKYLFVFCSEIKKLNNYKSDCGYNFIILELLPALLCSKPFDTAICDIFIQKMFSVTVLGVQKLCYSFRDEIKTSLSSNKPTDLAFKGISSLISHADSLDLEEAVVVFQSLSYILASCIPYDKISAYVSSSCESWEKNRLCFKETPFFSCILNGLCVLIEKFKITWPKTLESLGIISLSCFMLENTDLDYIVVVQIFRLVKLAILNSMSPNLALLLNSTEDCSIVCLIPLLYKRLYDPNWEVRDSCLEVINAIAELSESKYPDFQQFLIENDFFSLIIDMMEGDSESYVRASAIQVLTSMTKIQSLKEELFKMEVPQKVIKLLRNESEGIVRREAALMIKQIYVSLNDPSDDIVSSFYEIMGDLAVNDLHWEVKVNSLLFWEAVIQRTVTDQGMIDGFFPKVTFSKEHKKIVTLTEMEVKLRLDKVLKKLSDIGCLYVLLLSLNDDCDMPVIQKSAQILSDFINILKRYEVLETCDDSPIPGRVSVKRKSTDSDCCEKRKPACIIDCEEVSQSIPQSSDRVIDGIVNEKDIHLLVNVCNPAFETEGTQKRIWLKKIKPEAFLSQVQDFELEKFLEDKQKWRINLEVDLVSLVNETCLINLIEETNIMDCY